MKQVELLAPAGSPEALDAAIGAGADAVYLGLKNFNARLRSTNFAYSQFEGAVRSLHRMRRKLYVTVNTVFEQREADRMYQLLKYLASLEPDGLIVQDFGIISMVQNYFPALKLHASTQMNIASARGANILSKQGISRVVLARELSLEEIRDLRTNTNVELELFVHGALCVSASGLCLFSSFLGGKSANRGMCTQACRRYYRRYDHDEGGYYFSPSDLQLIDLVPELADLGINAFKIEGRMKSAEYVGTVVSAYRRVIDALDAGERAVQTAIEESRNMLRNDFARTKTVFYCNASQAEQTDTAHNRILHTVDWLKADQSGGTGIPLGSILKVKSSAAGSLALISRGSILPVIGDSVRFHRADDSNRVSHKITCVEQDKTGSLEPSDPANWWISMPPGFNVGDEVYLMQTKGMTKRYVPVIPHNLDTFKRTPGREQAPGLSLSGASKAALKTFPEGIYTAVSRIEDLYIVQSVRPVKVMVAYNCKTAAHLLGNTKQTLPFKTEEIIVVFDPYFPQALDRVLGEEINRLLSLGYRYFVVNNPGHLSYFRNTDAVLIAGPYLYTFNRWAYSFVSNWGIDYVITPLENNRQNLERTTETQGRSFTFITIFAYPPLFRIRADLSSIYDFQNFSDTRDEQFSLISKRDGTIVIPETPFSIIDKTPFLQQAGFKRFILDVSGPPLKKVHYKDLMYALKNAAPLPNISRFNWKNGFYAAQESTCPEK